MKKLFIIAAFGLVSSCAFNPTKQSSNSSTDTLTPLRKFSRTPAADELNWWAVQEKNIQSATCRTKLPTSSSEIEAYYQSIPNYADLDEGQSEVFGITLVDEIPSLVNALAKLLTPESQYTKPEKSSKNFVKEFAIDAKCNKALCVAAKIFGPEVGPQMIFLIEKFNINTSPYTYRNADILSPDEINDVIKTFELVEPKSSPFSGMKQLIHFKRGYTRASYGDEGELVLANATIELFDGWSKKPALVRQGALYHELAHNYAYNQFQSYDSSNVWLKISHWNEGKEGELAEAVNDSMAGHPFVSKYGAANPAEDFAESVSAYRLNPDLLKQTSTQKYNLIKNYVFAGVEYTPGTQCRPKDVNIPVQKEIDTTGGNFTASEKENLKASCAQSFYSSLLNHSPVSFFDACVNFQATVKWSQKKGPNYSSILPLSWFDREIGFSNLKFKSLRKELSLALSSEFADWFLLSARTYGMSPNMTNNEFCQSLSRSFSGIFPFTRQSTDFERYSAIKISGISPSRGALLSLCLSLAKDTHTGEASLSSRGFTHETLSQYAKDYMH